MCCSSRAAYTCAPTVLGPRTAEYSLTALTLCGPNEPHPLRMPLFARGVKVSPGRDLRGLRGQAARPRPAGPADDLVDRHAARALTPDGQRRQARGAATARSGCAAQQAEGWPS